MSKAAEVEVTRPAPGVARFTVPLAMPAPDHLHVHVLETSDGPVLVDTGARGSESALAAGLKALGQVPERVLITHGHIDHWGLAATLAPSVLAHPGVAPSLAFAGGDRDGSPGGGWPDAAAMERAFAGFSALVAGVPGIDPLEDGQMVGDWRVLWTPGHDPGHVCLFREGDGVLLCGDLLLPGFTPNIQPAWDGADALGDFLGSLRRVAELPVRCVLPAHGDPYMDARRRADELAAHHAKRLDQLRMELAPAPMTLARLRDAVFSVDVRDSANAMLALMETQAHLEHLHRRGEAYPGPGATWVLAGGGR